MKKSLIDYISSLSASSDDILEDIISKKYRKFIKFFTLLKDYTEYITKMEYELSDKDTLSAKITFKKAVKMDEKKELIESWEESGYQIDAKITGKKMKLMIHYEE